MRLCRVTNDAYIHTNSMQTGDNRLNAKIQGQQEIIAYFVLTKGQILKPTCLSGLTHKLSVRHPRFKVCVTTLFQTLSIKCKGEGSRPQLSFMLYHITLTRNVFRLVYKKPSSGEIRVQNNNYCLNYINTLFVSIYIAETSTLRSS